MGADDTRDRLSELLTGPLSAAGLDLEALELSPAGKRRLVRIAVDKDGGVNMDDIAEASRQIARLLDACDAMGESPYTLEVTSPGTDRPLTLPRHWRRNQGRLVKVTRTDRTSFTGRLLSTDELGAVLRLEQDGSRDADDPEVKVAYADLARARVEIELNRKET